VTELVLLHVFLEPPPRPCTNMKSIRGSEGECKRLNPRGPFGSSTPSTSTVVALVETLEPDANDVYRVGDLLEILQPDDNDKSPSFRRQLLMDYARFSRGQERARRTLRSCFASSLGLVLRKLRPHTTEYTEPHVSITASPRRRTRWQHHRQHATAAMQSIWV